MEIQTISSLMGNQETKVQENVMMMLPKNMKKYVGHIREYENRYTFEYVSKDLKVKELFYFDDLGSKENAYQSALLFQKKWCQNHQFVTNVYYIINNEYVCVELNMNHKMKVDLEDIPYIENYNWRLQNNIAYPTTFQYDENKKRIFITFQKMKYNASKVHFKNNDRMDFRRENIIVMKS